MEHAHSEHLPLHPPNLTPGGNVPLELLRIQPFFSRLSEADLATVAALMRPVSYGPGDFVFKQGSAPDGLYVLESGEVLMWLRIGDMRKDVVRFQPGSTLCLASIVESSGRLSSMECLQPSRAWVLDIRAFNGLLAQKQAVALRVLLYSAENIGVAFCRSLGQLAQAMGIVFEAPVPADPLPEARATSEQDARLLEVLPFAKSLTAAELDTLKRVAGWRELKRGHRLLARGEGPGPLFLVVRGALEALLETTEGRKRLALRGPGTLCGVEGFAGKVNQGYSVVVRENATVLCLDRGELDRLYDAHDDLAIRLLQLCSTAINDQFNRDASQFVKAHHERTPAVTSEQLMAMRLA